MKKFFLLFLILAFSSAVADEQEDIAAFKAAYAEYTELIQNREDLDAAISAAEELQKLAGEAYGKKSTEYAMSTYQLARQYDLKGGDTKNEAEELALRHYKNYFRIAKRAKIPIDRAYVEKYLAYIQCDKNVNTYHSKIKPWLEAIKIAHKAELEIAEIADIEVKFSQQRAQLLDRKYAKTFLQSAIKKYKQAYGEQHYKYGEALLLSAIVNRSNNRTKEANKNFQDAMEIFSNLKQNDLELQDRTHEFLVASYENIGMSDRATYHCVALAQDYDFVDKTEIQPIFSVTPNFERSTPEQLEIGRWSATLEFTIDKDGRTKDIMVVESSDNIYNQPAIDAVRKFRYAPGLRNGQLVETPNVQIPIHQFWIRRN